VREGACTGAATMTQPSTLRLILIAADLAAVIPTLLFSSCRVCGTWREARCGGEVGSVGVLREMCCHLLRAGFQQCESFVKMGTVRCCLLSGAEDCITIAHRFCWT
jgi:hypothetical protein